MPGFLSRAWDYGLLWLSLRGRHTQRTIFGQEQLQDWTTMQHTGVGLTWASTHLVSLTCRNILGYSYKSIDHQNTEDKPKQSWFLGSHFCPLMHAFMEWVPQNFHYSYGYCHRMHKFVNLHKIFIIVSVGLFQPFSQGFQLYIEQWIITTCPHHFRKCLNQGINFAWPMLVYKNFSSILP